MTKISEDITQGLFAREVTSIYEFPPFRGCLCSVFSLKKKIYASKNTTRNSPYINVTLFAIVVKSFIVVCSSLETALQAAMKRYQI